MSMPLVGPAEPRSFAHSLLTGFFAAWAMAQFNVKDLMIQGTSLSL